VPDYRVYVTKRIAAEALDKISEVADMKVWDGEFPVPADVLLGESKDVDGLLCMLTDRVDAGIIENSPKLKVISNCAVGYDNIDISEATKRSIVVGNTPGVLTDTTADLAFGLLIAAARRIVEADKYTRKGMWKTWSPMVLLGQDVFGSTLGIIGLGQVGTAVAKRAGGFQMKVLYHDKVRLEEKEKELGAEYVPSLMELLSRADFISLHCPLDEDSRCLISAEEFKAMKSTAILINTSRGSVVDQKSLYQALKSGQITAAGIDVTEVEPIPLDDPLLTLENLVITPHIGSASIATRTRMAVMAADNLIAGLLGEIPPCCVNPEVVKK